MNVPKVTYEVYYNGKNITGDILPYVVSLNYIDKSNSESDELEIVVEDSAGRWRYEWYPTKGDSITAQIYYLGNVLQCGVFTIDEITATGTRDSGDTISIKAIAAGINNTVRTKNSFAHENKTLREIVNTVAAKHKLKVEGNIANVRISRLNQYREGDLKFLHRLATDYGYTFSIRGDRLTFTNIFEIEKKKAALTLHRNEIFSYSITDKTNHTYKKSKVKYHNPQDKKVIHFEHTETETAYEYVKGDTLEMRVKAENQQQAEIKARAALYKANSLQQEGSIEMPGNILAIAGNNCELVGFGMLSGIYYLQTSTHTVTKDGGYLTNLEIKRVGLVEDKKKKFTEDNNDDNEF